MKSKSGLILVLLIVFTALSSTQLCADTLTVNAFVSAHQISNVDGTILQSCSAGAKSGSHLYTGCVLSDFAEIQAGTTTGVDLIGFNFDFEQVPFKTSPITPVAGGILIGYNGFLPQAQPGFLYYDTGEGSISLALQGRYMFKGLRGPTPVHFFVSGSIGGDGPHFGGSCAFTVQSVAYGCLAPNTFPFGGGGASFIAEPNHVYRISLNAILFGRGVTPEGGAEEYVYRFDVPPGVQVSPVPEPSSILLVITGLIAGVAKFRTRVASCGSGFQKHCP